MFIDFDINYLTRTGFSFLAGASFWNETLLLQSLHENLPTHSSSQSSSTPSLATLGCLAHTAAAGGWQLLHLVPAVRVIEEGHVFVVGGPAAGRVGPQLPRCRLREHPAQQQVGEGEVVVGADAWTRPAAVLEEDGLVWVVAQPQVSNLQQDGAQAAFGL